MPTATKIRTAPMFGNREPTGWTNARQPWELTQHSERIMLESGHALVFQTSDEQSDDGVRGTWVAALIWPGVPAKVIAQAHFPWHDLDAMREGALAWADSVLAAEDETKREPVSELAGTVEP